MTGRVKVRGMTLSALSVAALAVLVGLPGLSTARGLSTAQGLSTARSFPGQSFPGQSLNGPGRHGAGREGQDQLIPLYDNGDPADWARACSQANGTGGGSWIIADIAGEQGPGTARLPAWAHVIGNCYDYGRASVIGYVWTGYGAGGQASIASIESQVDAWYALYPGSIAGIFFDGVSDDIPGTATSNQGFYRALASYVHAYEGDNDEVVFNFGVNPGSDWMLDSSNADNADIVVTFEGSYDTPGENPYTSWAQAAWEARYAADDFAAIIYNAPASASPPQPASACGSLAQQNIGYVYVGTSYDQLAPYFGDFLTDSLLGNC
jgi:hypothetical protein